MTVIRSSPLSGMGAATLYAVLRLRQDVFVLEQECLFADLDGRDLEPGTVQWWTEGPDGAVLATLRALDDGSVVRIGRVATAREARGAGIARELVLAVLSATRGPVVLDAQSHLEGWYERLGFVRDGDGFLDDGIPHLPMRLAR
ncbi:GNAT family N-acetyltransferase [Phycicoccus sp. HDW14]|uniref:GNAT family N-acetyltransferase n=1 Tax=Phycicoccus sp. HDW14 TaxID=2714941 RepID=UPI001F0CE6A8|nr:GNAT family N-acetyltransferase [Phycicoccus sp. HDW14]